MTTDRRRRSLIFSDGSSLAKKNMNAVVDIFNVQTLKKRIVLILLTMNVFGAGFTYCSTRREPVRSVLVKYMET